MGKQHAFGSKLSLSLAVAVSAVLTACGGGGGGAKMEPSAILVIKCDRIELFNIKGNPYSSSFDRLIGLVPDLVSKLKSDKYIYLNDEQ